MEPKGLLRKYRPLTHNDKVNVLYMRFNSLTDFEKEFLSINQIQKRLQLDKRTIKSFIYKTLQSGTASLVRRRLGQSFNSRTMPLTDSFEHDQELLSEEMLRKWAHLSLR